MDHLRPTRATVDLVQLGRNLQAIRASIPPGTRILAAVKGDAYGHGALPVRARSLRPVPTGSVLPWSRRGERFAWAASRSPSSAWVGQDLEGQGKPSSRR